MSGLPPFATVERTSAFGSFVPIVLQKSFYSMGLKFCEP
jgi:hypothetical protein